ncbi:hypothetical protein [Sandaracinus amylolyticus]|uniref:hypothetical protein n=1 Tax=Sandaracinus amylolyticus TaxID=927083 RepID=UPI001F332EC7|nr:hypothetical protein [Sandaracinus amylolyticus]UJR81475.1 Hypothetical protein I5071_35340 [Sandaracinus amylolyticus]
MTTIGKWTAQACDACSRPPGASRVGRWCTCGGDPERRLPVGAYRATETRPRTLRDDLEVLRERVDAALAAMSRRADGLELMHLHVALRRVERRIGPPLSLNRPGPGAKLLARACDMAAAALDGTRWPSDHLQHLADEAAGEARHTAALLRGRGES